MNREMVRVMKRVIREGAAGGCPRLASEAALALLARSIEFGHGRLAVIRLGMAVHAGADVPVEHWTYCRQVCDQSRDTELGELYRRAAGLARRDKDVMVAGSFS